jgi:O-antigen ligase
MLTNDARCTVNSESAVALQNPEETCCMAARRNNSPPDDAATPAADSAPERMPVLVETVTRLHTAVAWVFFAFVFSIPMEEASNAMHVPISMSKLFGYIFVIGSLIQPQICFRRPPAAFWWFFAYLCIDVVLGAMQEQRYSDEVFRLLAVSVQMIVLLWLSCNLLRYEYIVKGAMISVALSCLLVAILQRFGVGEAVEVSNYGREARFTTFGQNANEQAYILGLGLLAMIHLTHGPDESLIRPRWLVWPVFVFMVAAIVQTGSRGSTLALGAGLAVYFMQVGAARMGGMQFIRNMAILGAAIGVVLALTFLSETARLRWERTLQSGHTAGRTFLYSLASDMIEEKPLFGWGPARNRAELYFRSGEISEGDFQNTALHVLAEAGIFGAFPFFVGCFLWLRAAWIGRRGPLGVLPLAMTACTLMVCMTGTWVYRKQFWLVIALSLISGSLLIRAKSYRLAELETIRPPERKRKQRKQADASKRVSPLRVELEPPIPKVEA